MTRVPTGPVTPGGPPRSSGPGPGRAPGPHARIGRYEILAELGRGGMGVVYRAFDPSLRREVAIKMVLAAGAGRARQVERFVREARAAARLRHRSIVSVHEVGSDEDRPFIVMDLVPGETLAELVEREPMAPRAVVAAIRDVALGLQHAHDHGILHRDVKPQNILLDASGHAHLTDFGLARDIASDAERLTVSGQLVGTPAYVAPEQARGDRGAVAAPSDVYGLGGALYFGLLRRPPHEGDTVVQIIAAVLQREPERPRDLDPEIHPDLERIVLRCLAKRADERYATAAALAADLTSFLEGRAISIRTPNRRERLGRWVREHPAAAAVMSAVAVSGIVFGAILAAREVQTRARLEEALVTAERRRDEAVAAGERLTAALGAAERERERARAAEVSASGLGNRLLVEKAHGLIARRRFIEAAPLLARSLERETTAATRSALIEAVAATPRLAWTLRRQLRADLAALDPTGDLLVLGGDWGKDVRLIDLRHGRLVANAPIAAHALSASPDGATLAVGSDRGVHLLELPSLRERAFEHRGQVDHIAWVEGGDRLAALATGQAALHDAATGRIVGELANDLAGLRGLSVSPDGERLALWSGELVDVRRIDDDRSEGRIEGLEVRTVAWLDDERVLVASGSALHVREIGNGIDPALGGDPPAPIEHGAVVSEVSAVAPDRVVVVDAQGGVAVRDLATGETLDDADPLGPRGSRWPRLAVGHAGRRIAVAEWKGGVGVWDLSADGTLTLRATSADPDAVEVLAGHVAFAWSPDGEAIAVGAQTAGGPVRVLEARSGRALRRIPPADGGEGVASIAWSHDGATLAVSRFFGRDERGRAGSRVDIHDAATGAVVAELHAGEGHPAELGFSPDGRSIAAAVGTEVHVFDAATGRRRHRLEPPPRPRSSGTPITQLSRPRWLRDGRLYASNGVGTAAALWNADEPDAKERLPVQVREVAFHPDGRHVAFEEGLPSGDTRSRLDVVEVAGPDRAIPRTVEDPEIQDGEVRIWGIRRIAWSADGRALAASAQGICRVWRFDGRALHTLASIPIPGDGRHVGFDPSGRRLAVSTDGLLQVWELPRPTLEPAPPDATDGCAKVATAPAGTLVASMGKDHLRVWDRATGALILDRPHGDDGFGRSIAWSPDGARLVAVTTRRVRVLDPRRGELAPGWIDADEPRDATFVDGTREVAVLLRDRLFRWEPSTPGPANRDVLDRDAPAMPFASVVGRDPAGRILAISRSVEENRRRRQAVEWVDVASGRIEPVAVVATVRHPSTLDVSADGARIAATVEGAAIVFDVAARRELARLRRRDGAGALSVAWAPDGRLIALGCGDGAVVVWDPDERRPLFQVRPDDRSMSDIDWTDDGAILWGSADRGHENGAVGILDLERVLAFTPPAELVARVRDLTGRVEADGGSRLMPTDRLTLEPR